MTSEKNTQRIQILGLYFCNKTPQSNVILHDQIYGFSGCMYPNCIADIMNEMKCLGYILDTILNIFVKFIPLDTLTVQQLI